MADLPVGDDILITSITSTTTATLLYTLLSAGAKLVIGDRRIVSVDILPSADVLALTVGDDTSGFTSASGVVDTIQAQNLRERLMFKNTATIKLRISLK